MEGESVVGVATLDPLVAKLIVFCDQEAVLQRHQQFCRRYVDEFHGFSASADDEKTHRVHELFNEYEQQFEQTLQEFLDQEQISGEDFYVHCRRLQHCNDEADDSLTNLRILLSALDFDTFCQLMEREAIATQRALKEAEDMGL